MPNLLTREKIEAIYEYVTDILTRTGVEFDMESARDLFKKNGARIDGKRVYIHPSLLSKTLDLMPKHQYEPGHIKRLAAAAPFSNAPMILDDFGQSRRGTLADAIKLYQLTETSDLYESSNAGVIDPEGNDSEDPFIAQIAMLLKYSDKRPSLGLRATKSNSKNGDVYSSAKKAIQLIKAVKGNKNTPVMGQGICPMAPLAYDQESLINLTVLIEEGQDIRLCPCTLSFMTGPESLMGIVVHDLAIGLAGAAYIQLLRPGTPVGFNNSSTMTDMRTMQPVFAGPEYLHVQIMFYEVCHYLKLDVSLSGCFSDGVRNDYQAGFESCFTALAPYAITNVEEIWCCPGHTAAFAGGNFNKIIFDEELLINCNRTLHGMNLSIDPRLEDKLTRSLETKSFLSIGDVGIYRKEHRIPPVFDKRGIQTSTGSSTSRITVNAEKEIEKRCAAYRLPERSKEQKKLLQKHLPGQCKY